MNSGLIIRAAPGNNLVRSDQHECSFIEAMHRLGWNVDDVELQSCSRRDRDQTLALGRSCAEPQKRLFESELIEQRLRAVQPRMRGTAARRGGRRVRIGAVRRSLGAVENDDR